jgi:prophage DNA circulation protein
VGQLEKQVQRVHLEVLDQRDQLVQQAAQVQLERQEPLVLLGH